MKRAASATFACSTPVSMPMPCSIVSRSSVARLPAAPGAKGQPPNPPRAAVKGGDPHLQRHQHICQRHPVGVVEVVGGLLQRQDALQLLGQAGDLDRHSSADGVPRLISSTSIVSSRSTMGSTCWGAICPS
jgi:hypothetical protein